MQHFACYFLTGVGVELRAVQSVDKLSKAFLIAVHLPVSTDEKFPGSHDYRKVNSQHTACWFTGETKVTSRGEIGSSVKAVWWVYINELKAPPTGS